MFSLLSAHSFCIAINHRPGVGIMSAALVKVTRTPKGCSVVHRGGNKPLGEQIMGRGRSRSAGSLA